jgi:hypothetical protein
VDLDGAGHADVQDAHVLGELLDLDLYLGNGRPGMFLGIRYNTATASP